MNHDGEGETPEEDRVRPVGRKVTFESDYDNGEHCNGESDIKPVASFTPDGNEVNGHRHETSACTNNGSRTKGSCDADTREQSSSKIKGILRPRSSSPSPLAFQALISTRRFKQSKLSKAMRRSNETREIIEKLKKQIFQRYLEQQQKDSNLNVAHSSSPSQSQDCIQNSERNRASITKQERRRICLQRAKNMMNQSLPASMMPFVEETLKAAHFLYRRRMENGHGRIVHKILVAQHKQILKELEHNEDRNGETSHSSRQKSQKTEPS